MCTYSHMHTVIVMAIFRFIWLPIIEPWTLLHSHVVAGHIPCDAQVNQKSTKPAACVQHCDSAGVVVMVVVITVIVL